MFYNIYFKIFDYLIEYRSVKLDFHLGELYIFFSELTTTQANISCLNQIQRYDWTPALDEVHSGAIFHENWINKTTG